MKTHLKLNKAHLALLLLAVISLLLVLGGFIYSNRNADAVSVGDFRAGNIIDDGVFYNKDAMSVQEIQNFLNQQIPNCDTWGTWKSGYGNLTNAQYAQQIRGWHGPPYACITNYHENPTTGETSYEKGGGYFAGGISAAQIIYNAAQQYGISPKVLLVLLKKESAGPLTNDTWPLKSQYRYAMGYACPDSGANYSANCSATKAGFYNQMTTAAWQLKYYKEHPNDYRYRIGWNQIQYAPDPACGSKSVNIENIATLSLYIYTPYTPNDGALNNYPGTAPCGAYGNRNFFMFYNEWFGSTRMLANFEKMETSRYLASKSDGVRKINLQTGEVTDTPLKKDQLIYFTGRTSYNGNWCLRSQYDRDVDNKYCVPLYNLNEAQITFTNLPNTRMEVTSDDAVKYNPVTKSDLPVLSEGQVLTVSQKFSFKGTEYFRSKFDVDNNLNYGLMTTNIERHAIPLTSIPETDLYVNSKDPTQKTDLWSFRGSNEVQALVYGQKITFNATTEVNGVKYYISKHDYNNGNPSYGVRADLLSTHLFEDFITPRDMKITKPTCKFDLVSMSQTSLCYEPNTVIYFDTKISVNGKTWYRSGWETTYNTALVIDPTDLTEVTSASTL